MLAILAVLAAAAWWLAGRGEPTRGRPAQEAALSPALGPARAPVDAPPLGAPPVDAIAPGAPPSAADGPRTAELAAPGTEAAPRPPAERDFRGRGSIHGALVLSAGARLPETWTVIVEPSRALAGRERAETRRVERPGSETSFELEDLPLAGYDVRVDGEGITSHPVPVLIVRGSPHVFVNVSVHPRGILDGVLLDVAGRPVEGILVVLEDLASGERTPTRTAANGGYAFTALADGDYRIHFGGAGVPPLIEPEELYFRSPSMRFPVRRVPELGTLVVRAIEPDGTPIPDAVVQGYSTGGGLIDVQADAFGLARALNVRPGRYRLTARHAETGREGRSTIEIEGGAEKELIIALVARN